MKSPVARRTVHVGTATTAMLRRRLQALADRRHPMNKDPRRTIGVVLRHRMIKATIRGLRLQTRNLRLKIDTPAFSRAPVFFFDCASVRPPIARSRVSVLSMGVL